MKVHICDHCKTVINGSTYGAFMTVYSIRFKDTRKTKKRTKVELCYACHYALEKIAKNMQEAKNIKND